MQLEGFVRGACTFHDSCVLLTNEEAPLVAVHAPYSGFHAEATDGAGKHIPIGRVPTIEVLHPAAWHPGPIGETGSSFQLGAATWWLRIGVE